MILREESKEKNGWILCGKSAALSSKFIDREFIDVANFGTQTNNRAFVLSNDGILLVIDCSN